MIPSNFEVHFNQAVSPKSLPPSAGIVIGSLAQTSAIAVESGIVASYVTVMDPLLAQATTSTGIQKAVPTNNSLGTKTEIVTNELKGSVKISALNSSETYISRMKQVENDNNSLIAVVDLKYDSIFFSAETLSQKKTSNLSNIVLISSTMYPEITQEINRWKKDTVLYDKVVNEGKNHIIKLNKSNSNTKKLLVISPVKDGSEINKVVFSMATLQPVDEAADVIKEYFVYIFGAAAILIVLLSWIYSNMVSKPLLRINLSAKHMAQLDFSIDCPVSSEDELGDLSNTLNFLSKKLDKTLKELNAANVKLVDDIQLQKQQEKIRKDFVSSISHELKTPVSLVQGYAEGIKDGIAAEEEKEFYLDVIIDEANRMSGLISDMLDLSQLESGSFKLDLQEYNLLELISNIMKKHSQAFMEKQIVPNFNVDSEKVLVIADGNRIHQVFTNLLNNAMRHTPSNKKIFINVRDTNETIMVEIENQGDCIPDEEIEYIWERFYKVDKSGNRSMGGYGIGLAVVRSILELHNVNYGVKNTVNGVMFYFELNKAFK